LGGSGVGHCAVTVQAPRYRFYKCWSGFERISDMARKTSGRTAPVPAGCPFCGSRTRLTKEHAWAQWLRAEGPAHAVWAEHYRGSRQARRFPQPVISLDGILRHVDSSPNLSSEFLATVTVKVCGNCNSTWMNRLENHAQELLRPVFRGGTVRLTPDDHAKLATWAVKSIIAYGRATLAREVDPFPPRSSGG
jgi:hypothetical protein